jgi:predicted nucleotidyltransferase
MDDYFTTVIAAISRALERSGIEFALVGGLAASLQGRIRATEDVDLIIDADVEATLTFLRAMDPAEFQPWFPEVETVVHNALILALEHVPSEIRLDLAVGVSGFEQQIVRRAERCTIADFEIPIATAEDLVLMKALAGRPQDEADIAGIIEKRSAALDWDYCLAVASQLDSVVDFDLLEKIKHYRSS